MATEKTNKMNGVENNQINGHINGDSNEYLPKWLNESFFADVLKKQFKQYEVTNFHVEGAFGKGENYASSMHKVSIDIKLADGATEHLSYLTKSSLASDFTNEFTEKMSVFPKEMEIYEKVLPQVEILFKQIGMDVQLGPKCIKVQKMPPVIVLEDLKVKNFSNVNRLEGLDLQHAELTLEKLSLWHAATARIYQLRGAYSDMFMNGMLTPGMEVMFQEIQALMWPVMREGILLWENGAKYLDKMERMQKRFIPVMQEAEKVDRMEFNVLNHGDAWINNIMYKHNEDGTLADVKFVDFQICKWGSPAQDLQYFILSSCNNDIKATHFDHLIRHYHQHLVKNLKLVKYSGDIPSLIDLHTQILKKAIYAHMTAFSLMPVILMDPSDNASMENLMKDDPLGLAMKRAMYTNPRYIKAINSLIPFLENRGILDL